MLEVPGHKVFISDKQINGWSFAIPLNNANNKHLTRKSIYYGTFHFEAFGNGSG